MNTHGRRRKSRSRNTGRPASSTQAISPSRTALFGLAQTKDIAERDATAVEVSPCDLIERGSEFAGAVVSIRGEIASGFEVFGLRLSCGAVEGIVWLDVPEKLLEPKFTDIEAWAPVHDFLEYARRKAHPSDLAWQPYTRPSDPVSVRNDQAWREFWKYVGGPIQTEAQGAHLYRMPAL